MPERPGVHIQIQTQKVKDIASLLPHIAVPAGTACKLGAIHLEGWMAILPVGVMISERTAAEPVFVQLHVAPDHRERVLCLTPVPYRRAGRRRGEGNAFC